MNSNVTCNTAHVVRQFTKIKTEKKKEMKAAERVLISLFMKSGVTYG